MTLHLHLQFAGFLLIALGLGHWFISRYFRWNEETQRLTLFTRQVFHVHCFFIALMLIFMGALSVSCPDELLRPAPLSRAILGGFAAFWALRLLAQFFVYDSLLWRGKAFFTAMHWLFSGLWLYLTATYTAALMRTTSVPSPHALIRGGALDLVDHKYLDRLFF